jgi:hypothetical protein
MGYGRTARWVLVLIDKAKKLAADERRLFLGQTSPARAPEDRNFIQEHTSRVPESTEPPEMNSVGVPLNKIPRTR